jgi:hypothetical protein
VILPSHSECLPVKSSQVISHNYTIPHNHTIPQADPLQTEFFGGDGFHEEVLDENIHKFQPGQYVFVKAASPEKLGMQWIGPQVIVERESSGIFKGQDSLTKRISTISADRIKRAFLTSDVDPAVVAAQDQAEYPVLGFQTTIQSPRTHYAPSLLRKKNERSPLALELVDSRSG